jgi:hypothetical protein
MYIDIIGMELNRLQGCSPAITSDKCLVSGTTFIEHVLSKSENSNPDKALSEVKLDMKSNGISPTGSPQKEKMGRAGFEPA